MTGAEGLDDHFSALATAAGTAAYLDHQLVAALECPEIRVAEQGISIQDVYQIDIPEVKSFGNHLCPYQDVDGAVFEIIQDLLEGIFATGVVKVETGDSGIGKQDF